MSITQAKFISLFAIIILLFVAGYHLKSIVDKAKEESEARAEIAATSAKLLQDNTIDQNYEKQINIIDTAADNANQRLNHETDGHNCIIARNWVRILHNASR